MLAGLVDHAQWIVFALILANQAGVPVFAAPALLGVGALVWTGDANVVVSAPISDGTASADGAVIGRSRHSGASLAGRASSSMTPSACFAPTIVRFSSGRASCRS